MPEALQSFDEKILFLVNGAHAPWADVLMHWASNRFVWIPFYALLLLLVWWRFRNRIIYILPAIAFLILLSDQSSHLVKDLVKRDRPCHNEEIAAQLHVPDGCGGNWGFFSSHASNTFALAMFLFLLWKNRSGQKWLLLLFLWAGLVSYSRMYLGVHYPLDVLAGALNGMGWALLVTLAARKWISAWPQHQISDQA